MDKKTLRIITIVATIVVCLSICTSVFAAGEEKGWPKPDTNGTEKITTLGGNIMGILQVFGMVVSVLVLMVLGIKYMMGSAEEKAEYKKTFIPYIVGAILLFGASAIAQMVFSFATQIK